MSPTDVAQRIINPLYGCSERELLADRYLTWSVQLSNTADRLSRTKPDADVSRFRVMAEQARKKANLILS